MADVRLTATNPDDSTVVPVACNAKGELKLEEIPQFDGNVDGDLTVSGNASVNGSGSFGRGKLNISNQGYIKLNASAGGAQLSIVLGNNYDVPKTTLYSDGSATFKEHVEISNYLLVETARSGFDHALIVNSNAETVFHVAANGTTQIGEPNISSDVSAGINLYPGAIRLQRTSADGDYLLAGYQGRSKKVTIYADGSAQFAGNKAGFTAEGHFWCTTRRGDTVILDATSNGMGLWEAYTPTPRRDKVEEWADAWAEKNVLRPKPEESSQDGTETTQ